MKERFEVRYRWPEGLTITFPLGLEEAEALAQHILNAAQAFRTREKYEEGQEK